MMIKKCFELQDLRIPTSEDKIWLHKCLRDLSRRHGGCSAALATSANFHQIRFYICFFTRTQHYYALSKATKANHALVQACTFGTPPSAIGAGDTACTRRGISERNGCEREGKW